MPLKTKESLVHDFVTLTMIEGLAIRNLREFLAKSSTSIEALELCRDLRELHIKRKNVLDQLKLHDVKLDGSLGPAVASGTA